MRALGGSLGPKELKERLAAEIVELYHGARAAKTAREMFEAVFSRKELPKDMPTIKVARRGAGAVSGLDLVIAANAVKSKSDARRLIEQGGLEFDGKTVKSPGKALEIRGGEVVRIGKKKFFRLSTGAD